MLHNPNYERYGEDVRFEILKGQTILRYEMDAESIILYVLGGRYVLYHSQDCCESVTIEDITGSLDDLVGHPILQAEEVINHTNPKDNDECFTWTFYKLATIKGSVTIRWYGSSNGYYSESVDCIYQRSLLSEKASKEFQEDLEDLIKN